MENLNQYVLAKAIQNKVCQAGADGISTARSVQDLLDMYIKDIDFCLSTNFPTNGDLQRLAGEYLNQNGVYIDQTFKLSDRSFIVALGDCSGSIRYDGYSAAQLYVKHSSKVKVTVSGNAKVFIDCFDQSELNVTTSFGAKCLVSVYGNAKVITAGDGITQVINKFKDTY
jgi:hypothetical protein